MDIYQAIKKDHDEVKHMLEEQIEEAKSGSGQDMMEKIVSELSAHMEGEEKVFYPRLEEDEDAREKILEAYEEHHVAKQVLKELGHKAKDDERWIAKLTVMKEIIEHHVEEEEKSVFKMAKQLLGKDDAREIGEEFENEKKRLMERSRKK